MAALIRFGSDGVLDPTFGEGGIAYLWEQSGLHPDNADAIALLPDGAFLVAGGRIARFLPTGAIDPSFDPGQAFSSSAIAVQRNGKIVALSTTSEFRTYRFLPSGALDLTYGEGGTVHTDIGIVLKPLASSITLQPDGRIVVAGSVGADIVDGGEVIGELHDFYVVRYIGDPVASSSP